MVRQGQSLLFFLSFFAITAGAEKVEMQCSKPRVYEGELFRCDFILTAPEPQIVAEVAKFPEFHGFYKENISLKQGPLWLDPPKTMQAPYSTVLGSYWVYSKTNPKQASFQPMEVYFPQTHASTISSGNLPALQKLPPPPPEFTGLVGVLDKIVAQPLVEYDPTEPASFKLTLLGRLNFLEVNRVSLPATFPLQPDEIKVSSSGGFNYGNKTFTYLGKIKEQATQNTSFSITTFNPDTQQYENSQVVGPIIFQRTPETSSSSILSSEAVPYEAPSGSFWMIGIGIFLSLVVSALFIQQYGKKAQPAPEDVMAPENPAALEATPETFERVFSILLNRLQIKFSMPQARIEEILQKAPLSDREKKDLESIVSYRLACYQPHAQPIEFPKESIERLMA